MAPATLDDIDKQLKVIVQYLYNLIVQGLDHQGSLTEEAMKREMCVKTKSNPDFQLILLQYIPNNVALDTFALRPRPANLHPSRSNRVRRQRAQSGHLHA